MSDPKIRYDIEADVKGGPAVDALAGDLDQLAKVLDGEVKDRAQAAARELRELGEQEQALAAFRRLQAEAAAAAADLKRLEAGAKAFGAQIAASGVPTQQQAVRLQQLNVQVDAAKAKLDQHATALGAGTARLERYGIAAADVVGAQQRLNQSIGRVKGEVAELAPAYLKVADASDTAVQRQRAGHQALGESLQGVGNKLSALQGLAVTALGGGLAGGLVSDLAQTADAYNNLAARIQLVTGEGAAFTAAMEGVQRIAVATRSDLEATGTLYTKLAEAGKTLGLSQQQALGLTQTINQAIQVSGGSAESANAAITQLVQGLQGGALRGDEFNSVMEQAPRLAKALADGLGVGTGELRKMAEQGQLTSETVINSLRGQTDVVASEFAKLPPTVGGALQNLSTAWTVYVGNVDKASGASRSAAEAIQFLSQNLAEIGDVLATAGKGVAALFALNLAKQFADWALGAKAAAAGAATATAATTGHTASVQANTVALEANTAAKVRNSGAGLVGALMAQQQAAKGNAQALGEMAGALGRVGPAATAAGGAVAQAASKGGLLARSAAVMGAGFRGLTALLGGPVGLIALTAVYAKDLGELAAKAVLWVKGQDNLEQSTRKAAEAERAAAEAASARSAQLEQQRLAAEQATQASFNLTRAGQAQVNALVELQKRGELTNEVIANIGKDFDLSTAAGIQNAGTVLDALLQKGVITSDQFKAAWAKALDGQDLTTFGFKAQEAFGTAGRGAEQLAATMDARLAAAVQRTGVELAGFTGGMGAAATRAVGDIDTVIGGMDRLRAQGLDVAAVLTASIGQGIDTADSQEAIEAVGARIEEVRQALGDTVADGLLDQARQKADELRGALEDAKPGIHSTREAMRLLGVTTQASLDDAARKARAAYEQMKRDGTASAREMRDGFVAMAQAQIRANGGVVSEVLKLEAALHGVSLAGGAAGRGIASGMDAAADATRRAAAELQRLQALSSQNGSKGGTRHYDDQGNLREANGELVNKPDTPSKGMSDSFAMAKTALGELQLKQRAGTLSADDLKLAQAAYEGAVATADGATAAGKFLGYRRDTQRLADEAEAIFERVKAMQGGAAATTPAGAAAGTPVTINLGSSSTRVNVASASDAQALQGLLQQLTQQSARTY